MHFLSSTSLTFLERSLLSYIEELLRKSGILTRYYHLKFFKVMISNQDRQNIIQNYMYMYMLLIYTCIYNLHQSTILIKMHKHSSCLINRYCTTIWNSLHMFKLSDTYCCIEDLFYRVHQWLVCQLALVAIEIEKKDNV